MVAITSSQLAISHGGAPHPGRRQVRIDCDLVVEAGDPVVGRELTEQVTLQAVDRHDAAVAPSPGRIFTVGATFVAEPGTRRRTVVHEVDRVDLDVEADWWATSNEGEPIAIAEWLDHLAGEIALFDGDTEVARASTPVVTGSWGALGTD